MTILFVDHHDSFVHSLISWFKKNYSGGIQIVTCNEFDKVNLQKIRAVVFSPGPGHPSEYVSSISFYRKIPPSIPFLGVCLGHQIMLYAHGAQLSQVASMPVHGAQIKISKKINSRLLPQNGLKGHFVLYNSLGIQVSDRVFQYNFTMLAANDKYVLAAEHKLFPHLGVQFHPESFASPAGSYFLQCFLKRLIIED